MNNFVFHEEYIIDVPKDRLNEFLHYIVDYGLYNKIPELNDFELVFWKTIQRRIDTDKNFYEITCIKRKINAINVRVKNNKATEKDLSNLQQYELKLNELNEQNEVKRVKRNNSFNTKLNELNEQNEVKLPHYDIDTDIDYDSDYDIDIDYDIDTDIEHQKMPIKESPSHIQYSKELFNLLKDAGLPCAKKNEVSFLQTDFKNALNYLHNTPSLQHLSSSDVIGAVKNYIKVLNDPKCYVSTKMNIFSFVKSKQFYDYLPANFDLDSFKSWENKNKADAEEKEELQKEIEYIECPSCRQHKMYWNTKKNRFICTWCLKYFDADKKEVQ